MTSVDDLSNLSAEAIDSLPFGYIALAEDGTVRKYNRYEADLARKDPNEVLGKNFFREVAPCTQVREFEGRFRDFVDGTIDSKNLSFEFTFAFRHGTQRVRIGFVRSPLGKETIVTVNRIRDLEVSLSAELEHDPTRGRSTNAAGQSVVVTNADFWLAFYQAFEERPEAERRPQLRRLGHNWGLQHALRVDHFVQGRHERTLREVELQVALESLSGSAGVQGLGRFDVDLGHRRQGLLLVEHGDSPFAEIFGDRDEPVCDLLAGFHAGLISYLSGRQLDSREISCGRRPDAPCRFVVGTPRRLERLFDPQSTADEALRATLGIRATGGGDDG